MVQLGNYYVTVRFLNDNRFKISVGVTLEPSRNAQFCCDSEDNVRELMWTLGFSDDDLGHPDMKLYWNAKVNAKDANAAAGEQEEEVNSNVDLDASFEAVYGGSTDVHLQIELPKKLRRCNIDIEEASSSPSPPVPFANVPQLAKPGHPIILHETMFEEGVGVGVEVGVKAEGQWCPLVLDLELDKQSESESQPELQLQSSPLVSSSNQLDEQTSPLEMEMEVEIRKQSSPSPPLDTTLESDEKPSVSPTPLASDNATSEV